MEIKKIGDTDIYEFKSKGTLSEADADRLNKAFQEFHDRGQKIKVLGVIDEVARPEGFSSLDDIWSMKGNALKVVEKYAILTDNDWLENALSLGNFLTPSIPMKSFDEDEREEAIEWLNERTIREYNMDEFDSNIEIEKMDARSYQVRINHSSINYAAMKGLYELIDEQGRSEKVNIMVVFDSFPSLDSFKALVQGLKVDFKSIGKINKYAVVSEAKWIESMVSLGDFITPGLDMKFFKISALDEAKTWITQK